MKKLQPFLRVILFGALFIVVLAGLKNVFARVGKVRKETQFTNEVMDNDLVIALFYARAERSREDDRAARDKKKEDRKKMKTQQKTFRIASDTDPYKYAGVRFISVDVNREKLTGLIGKYRIAKPKPDNPVFALFKGGNLVTTKSGFLSKPTVLLAPDKTVIIPVVANLCTFTNKSYFCFLISFIK